MARTPRTTAAGLVYHVMNRATKGSILFVDAGDYRAYEEVLKEAKERFAISLFAYAVMRNHWHLLLSPQESGDLSRFMQWLTATHAVRWQLHHDAVGTGAVYQSRFKAVLIQTDWHFCWAARYVERNPVRANLVALAEDWSWSSHRAHCRNLIDPLIDEWPIPRPQDWANRVNVPETEAELKAFRSAARVNGAFGDEAWQRDLVDRGLMRLKRARGRPAKKGV